MMKTPSSNPSERKKNFFIRADSTMVPSPLQMTEDVETDYNQP